MTHNKGRGGGASAKGSGRKFKMDHAKVKVYMTKRRVLNVL